MKVTEGIRTPFEGKCVYCGKTLAIYPGDNVENTARKENGTC